MYSNQKLSITFPSPDTKFPFPSILFKSPLETTFLCPSISFLTPKIIFFFPFILFYLAPIFPLWSTSFLLTPLGMKWDNITLWWSYSSLFYSEEALKSSLISSLSYAPWFGLSVILMSLIMFLTCSPGLEFGFIWAFP